MNIADLQLTLTPYTALYGSAIADANLAVAESSVEGRKGIVVDFYSGAGLYSRDLGTVFSWPLQSNTVLYTWQPTIIPQPENIYGRPTDWLGADTAGAKFIQGVLVTAQSFNVGKTFVLQSGDDLSFHPLLETPAVFNQQSQKAFSCVPFVAHTARVFSTDGVAWQLFDAQLVFQPYPELTQNWTTEFISFGLTGYGHIREINVPYVSTETVTLTLNFDQWPTQLYTLPSTAGVVQKYKQTINANKFKLCSFSLTSAEPFRIFMPEVEVKLGQWGRQDTYAILKPFGGPSNQGALV